MFLSRIVLQCVSLAAGGTLLGCRLTLEQGLAINLGGGLPLAMVLSGSYGPLSWEAHAQSIEGVLTRCGRSSPKAVML